MNRPKLMPRILAALLLLGGVTTVPFALSADSQPGKATVRGILGHAQFARGNTQFTALGPGIDLRPGDLIQTASKSAIELDLGDHHGVIRLTESAVMVLTKISRGNTNAGTGSEIQLDLRSGELLANIKPLPAGSRFEVKAPVGIAQSSGGQFRVSAQGYVVVMEGKVLFAHVPATGEPTANAITGPPPSYFSPAEGVRPAPKNLTSEVTKQFRAKLPRR